MHHSVMKCASYRPVLSLEELSLIKVTTMLCNNEQLLPLITKCNFMRRTFSTISPIPVKNWRAIQVKANQLVSEICIAGTLKKRILEYLWPVSYKIMVWKQMYKEDIGIKFITHWTDRGRLNNIKNVQCIVSDKRIPTTRRFIYACSVCLRKEIHDIWKEMSFEEKIFSHTGASYTSLLLFWVRTLEESDNTVEDVTCAAVFAVQHGLIEAVKHLFSISTTDARRRMAETCMEEFIDCLNRMYFLTEDEVDLGYFLYFEMSDESQKMFFNTRSILALSLFLYSYEDKLFLSLFAERYQSDLWMEKFYETVQLITKIFSEYYFELRNNFDYGNLFCKLWGMVPYEDSFKSVESILGPFICMVLIRDHFPFLLEKGARRIFQMPSINEIIMSGKPFRYYQSKWNFLQFLIREEIVTTFSLKKYKKTLLRGTCMDKSAWSRIVIFVRKMRKTS